VDQRAQEEIAAALLGAYASGRPIDPPTERHPDLTADDAYEIQ
jgi:2-keto-4-pentenoate hydratase